MKRRTLLGAAALSACTPTESPAPPASSAPVIWVGARHERGHRLRDLRDLRGLRGAGDAGDVGALPQAAVQRRAAVLVVGGGVAGLSAARAHMRLGIDDVQLLELEDSAGGNSRGHTLAGMACPLGAHYLPVPGADSAAREVAEWLHEIGLLKTSLGRTVPDDRALCHSPQERLFIDGAWVDGLLPPAAPGSPALQQMQTFSKAVSRLRGAGGVYTLPAHRGRWSAEQAALNTVTFAQWLDTQGLVDPHLRWYLDYCCRDDYGAGAATVSAWAGVHYYASRHGFTPPGDADAEREPVFTWPEGNAWLVQRLATPLGDRVHGGRTVLRVTEGRHGVQVLAWDEAAQRAEVWTAGRVVMAVPLFIAARIVEAPSAALRAAAALLSYAPWLVANLQLDQPLLARIGAPASWDNVVYGGRGLGYVDAMHQSLRAVPSATVLTAYHALPASDRAALLGADPEPWAARVLDELAPAHPDIYRRVRRIELMRWGHAMAIPAPGVHRHPALMALRAQRGRLRFAHGDLAGCSVFEEAFTAGCEVAGGG